ncbi:MAG TPA: MFS transporter [Candidatus Binatia bacterium]|nr:MFS transporter [Candidatus Binatia bacterium]
MSRDARLLFLARAVRMFGYGALGVILVLYLAEAGLAPGEIGVLLTLTLVGDTLISLFLTTHADRIGRRRTLILGAVLLAGAGVVFAGSSGFVVLLVAATIGVLSPSGAEVGPFLPIEQASLTEVTPADRRTGTYAWYNLVGSMATATGALVAGVVAGALQDAGWPAIDAYRAILLGYAVAGLALVPIVRLVSPKVEVPPVDTSVARRLGLHRSQGVVARLAALFALDAFGGGLIVQSLVAFWFHERFATPEPVLGAIFFGANILAAVSALAAARIAARIGLINTMVFTHLPSNVLLMLVPLMPTVELAVLVLLARFSISQMDVPARQSYTVSIVDPDERSAAAGITGVARTTGAALSPLIAAPLFAVPALAAVPFFLAGGLKIVYDLALWAGFRRRIPPGEQRRRAPAA